MRRGYGLELDTRHGSVRWAGEREQKLELVLEQERELVRERALVRVHDAGRSKRMDTKAKAKLVWALAAAEELVPEPRAMRVLLPAALVVVVPPACRPTAPYAPPH